MNIQTEGMRFTINVGDLNLVGVGAIHGDTIEPTGVTADGTLWSKAAEITVDIEAAQQIVGPQGLDPIVDVIEYRDVDPGKYKINGDAEMVKIGEPYEW